MDIISHVTDHVSFLFMATDMFSLTHTFFFKNQKITSVNIGMRFHTSVFEFPASIEKSDLVTLGSHVCMATMGSSEEVLPSSLQ